MKVIKRSYFRLEWKFVWFLAIILHSAGVIAQSGTRPYDATQPYSGLSIDGHRYDLIDGEIYQIRFRGQYAFADDRHQLGLSIPFMSSDQFTGIERRTGVGDLRLNYLFRFNPGLKENQSYAMALDINIPTGNVDDGHGLGAVLLSPMLSYSVRPIPAVFTLIGVRYVHSLKAVEGSWSGGGVIPGEPESDPKMRDLLLDLTGLLDIGESAWISTRVNYTHFFDEDDYTLRLVPELGKTWNDNISLAISSSLWIGGRRRTDSIIAFHVEYFL